MDITHWLATIDLLCARDFPAEHGRTDVGTGGPGYHIAELQTSGDFWEDDGTEREETEAQYECDRDGLGERLTERWGAPDVISLESTFERAQDDEDIPEPWASLSSHVPNVQLWRPPKTGRWMALGVSQWDKELPFQLLATVTEIAPP
ncbi:hypothetical protein OG585_07135 [Streptomyces sp. NBC_01340]|uniref:hypothetical protein n=1 Tax=unclassified Streptomyces TaxID=2593676 RepID=UPI0022518D3A|nr:MULTISPECIES: hypothetical protein [unclassified Streptomyces]MCX4452523.1 hypothetical protein [Streptomyces sp. NBC_01719]MCX4491883.1 hypothetical protein [Streptomyces sp. NBC_01728]WSI37079.1 hypothetical protein OG585_07135 [Streptomyces sp. NBC_01340]